MDNISYTNVIIGVSISLIVLLVYYNYKKTANERFKKTFPLLLLTLAILMPITSSIAFTKINLTKDELAQNLGNDFIQKAKEELAKENPDKLYLPNKDAKLSPDEFTKQGAIESVANLLNEVKNKENKEEVMKRFEALDKDEKKTNEAVSQSAIDKLYLADKLANDEMVKNTMLALMSISTVTTDEEFKAKDVIKLDEVVFDEYTKTAQVPLDVYLGRFTGMAFEMVYDNNNNTWKLNPYSLMRSFQLSQFLTSQPQQGETKSDDNN